MCIKYSKQLWVSLSSLEENHSSFKAWNVSRNYYHMFNLYQHIDQWMYNPVWYIPLVFDNIKSKYKQKANLSNTKVLRWRTIVALQKIHEGKIKLTIIKLQLKWNKIKGIQNDAYRLSSLYCKKSWARNSEIRRIVTSLKEST